MTEEMLKDRITDLEKIFQAHIPKLEHITENTTRDDIKSILAARYTMYDLVEYEGVSSLVSHVYSELGFNVNLYMSSSNIPLPQDVASRKNGIEANLPSFSYEKGLFKTIAMVRESYDWEDDYFKRLTYGFGISHYGNMLYNKLLARGDFDTTINVISECIYQDLVMKLAQMRTFVSMEHRRSVLNYIARLYTESDDIFRDFTWGLTKTEMNKRVAINMAKHLADNVDTDILTGTKPFNFLELLGDQEVLGFRLIFCPPSLDQLVGTLGTDLSAEEQTIIAESLSETKRAFNLLGFTYFPDGHNSTITSDGYSTFYGIKVGSIQMSIRVAKYKAILPDKAENVINVIATPEGGSIYGGPEYMKLNFISAESQGEAEPESASRINLLRI